MRRDCVVKGSGQRDFKSHRASSVPGTPTTISGTYAHLLEKVKGPWERSGLQRGERWKVGVAKEEDE